VVVPPHERNDDARFLHAAADFDAHVLGRKLVARGAPFIQQDANTFICAGAALWVVGLFMHAMHKGARFYPAQIAEMARQSYSHGQLRKGLTAEQIVMTLRQMGLNPHVEAYSNLHHLRSHDPQIHRAVLARLADFIHIFVDSGLPPILAYTTAAGEGHAVVVVGHDIAQRDDVPDEILWVFKKVLRNSYFVDTFFVMDDARGPYAPFHVWTRQDTVIPSLADCDRVAVIAPMPMESALDYHDAITELHKLVYLWNHVYANAEMNPLEVESGEGIDWSSYEIDDAPDNPIVTRTALLDSRYWKLQVLESALPTWLKRQYQAGLLPKFVWVIEISDFACINHPRRSDRQICGELLLDATANPHWPLDSLISFHVKGLLMQRTEDGLSFLRSEEQFSPYAPVLRSI
jgi:hypothetical protein